METENLQATLNQLRADLAETGVDPKLRDSLLVLEQDILSRLDSQHGDGPEPMPSRQGSDAQDGLAERAQEISARFAVEHPRLESVLRELGAILERIGI